MRTKTNKPLHESTPEYVDWLDAKGKIIGSVDRKLAHTYGLFHPVVHMWIVNGKNELILQQRSPNMSAYPMHWDSSSSGHYDTGETKEKGGLREMKEELGIRTTIHYIGYCDVEKKGKGFHHHEWVHYFWGKSNTKPHLQKEELNKCTAISPDKISTFIHQHTMTPTFMGGWKKYGKRLERFVK